MNVCYRRNPNFMIIGAAKAGTTSLYTYLSQHPEIYLPKEKETHFFEWDDLYARGLEFYLNHFYKNAEKFPARGDATPSYLHLPDIVIPRIRHTFADNTIRFIVLLRDPVKRSWSHYLHMVRIGEEELSFEEALALEPQRLRDMPGRWFGYFHDGLYAQQLSTWFDAFGREQFYVGFLEDLASNPMVFLQDIFRFLEVASDFRPQITRENEAREPRSRLLMRILVADFPGKQWLKPLFPPHIRRKIRVAVRTWNSRPLRSKPVMAPATESMLRQQYAPSVRELEALLGKSLQPWLPVSQ